MSDDMVSADEFRKTVALVADKMQKFIDERDAEIERLRAEVERLRAAGDALADDVDVALHSYSVGIYHTLPAWREARRG